MYIYKIKFITPVYKHGKFIKNNIDIKSIKVNQSYADETKRLVKLQDYIITRDTPNNFNARSKSNDIKISIIPHKEY
ncbi:MAG TPA: hypothetical protein DDW20_02305 [Firmicutes bacterium]|nr:hypothetical protein [Bacillota bacterium]